MLRRGLLRGEPVIVLLATAALGACGTGSAIKAGTGTTPPRRAWLGSAAPRSHRSSRGCAQRASRSTAGVTALAMNIYAPQMRVLT